MVTSDGEQRILPKRDALETSIGKLLGVEFLISCVTGTTTNKKAANNEVVVEEERKIRRGLGLFIVCTAANIEDEITKVVLDQGVEAEINYIVARGKDRKSKEYALDGLTKVIKVSSCICR